jgi:hypothetical protein
MQSNRGKTLKASMMTFRDCGFVPEYRVEGENRVYTTRECKPSRV